MPRLYLAVDNCFASKRWTTPAEWARLVRDLGLHYIEAGADVEHDPLHLGSAYHRRWPELVREAERDHGVRVANLYSGHGTYTTLGLAHWDPDAAARIRDDWLKAMIDHAAALDAGFGFFVHAFPQTVLDDPSAYRHAREELISALADVATYAAGRMNRPIGLEQMYAPHQIPWTIADTQELLTEVNRRSGGTAPLYTTIDTGHASGQARFRRPTPTAVKQAVDALRRGAWREVPWLGAGDAYEAVRRAAEDGTDEAFRAAHERVLESVGRRPYLFSSERDGDPYEWLRHLGPYSPIVHLQQTDGSRSAHLPFTARYNARGMITGPAVIRALAEGFLAGSATKAASGSASQSAPGSAPGSATGSAPALPPAPVEELYLTLEVFVGTAAHPFTALEELRESVAYWRRFVPEDGMELGDAVARLDMQADDEAGHEGRSE